MTKALLLTPLMLIAFYSSYAQDSILFRMHYLPNKVYAKSSVLKSHLEMTYAGNDTTMSRLKEKGISNPVINDKESTIKTVTTTYSLNAENKMPVQLMIEQYIDKDGNSVIQQGTKMTGTVETDKVPVFDSVTSDNPNEAVKKDIFKKFRNVLSQVPLPSKKMIIGDEYIQNIPVSIPLGTNTLKMNFAAIYKLISVTDSLANFNISMKFSIDMNLDTIPATGKGIGNGILVLDRINEYPLLYELNYSTDLTVVEGPVTIHAIITSKSKHEYSIVKR